MLLILIFLQLQKTIYIQQKLTSKLKIYVQIFMFIDGGYGLLLQTGMIAFGGENDVVEMQIVDFGVFEGWGVGFFDHRERGHK